MEIPVSPEYPSDVSPAYVSNEIEDMNNSGPIYQPEQNMYENSNESIVPTSVSPMSSPNLFNDPSLNYYFMSLPQEKQIVIRNLPEDQRITIMNNIVTKMNLQKQEPSSLISSIDSIESTTKDVPDNLSILEVQEPEEETKKEDDENIEKTDNSETKKIII